jgi:hypothetical protein
VKVESVIETGRSPWVLTAPPSPPARVPVKVDRAIDALVFEPLSMAPP